MQDNMIRVESLETKSKRILSADKTLGVMGN